MRSGAGSFELRLSSEPAGAETDFHVTVELSLSGPLRLLPPIFRRKPLQTDARITKKVASLLNAQA